MLNQPEDRQPAAPERIYYLDTARAVLMLLGIPYHCAQFYTARDWFATSVHTGGAAEWFGNFTHVFRMHAFFVIAGFFAAMLLDRRGPRRWIADRARRLLIPLAFAISIILPIDSAVAELMRGGDGHAVLRQLVPQLARAQHSWFLRVLFLYCCLAAAIYSFVPLRRRDIAVSGVRLLLTLGAFVVLSAGAVAALYGLAELAGKVGSLNADRQRYFFYAPFFAGGAALWAFPDAYARFVDAGRSRPVMVVLAIAALIALSFLERDAIRPYALAVGAYGAGVIGTWLTLHLAARHVDRFSAVIAFFVDGALTIYLVHFLFMIVIGMLLVDRIGVPAIEWGLATVGVFAASTAVYLATLRLPWLYYLFNGQRRRATVRPTKG